MVKQFLFTLLLVSQNMHTFLHMKFESCASLGTPLQFFQYFIET